MVQEFSGKRIAIIGAGASGCTCAYFLLKSGLEVTIFDYAAPLRTLLPTGGGRCNLAHAEYDFKELAKNYPRGEKFLYSVFSKFSTYDTISLFKELGIETYTQEDGRIFPTSNSSKDVREKVLRAMHKAEFIKEKVNEIEPLEKGYKIKTDKAEYFFSDIVISVGGSKYIKGLNHNIIPFTPALVGLNTDINNLSGVVLKDVYSIDCKLSDNLLFTHFGISGPLAFKISSVKTKDKFPYSLSFDLYNKEFDLQKLLNENPHKDLKNILSVIFPHRFAEYISDKFSEVKAHNINGKTRDLILNRIHNFKVNITGANKGEETVTAGGYDLNEINPKTMESKLYPNIYITGEALNIDGFCGGFNLQNAWSTGFVASEGIINKHPSP